MKITIIASAFRPENDLLTNHINHKRAINALANFGIKAKEAVGCYDNIQELSLVFEIELPAKPLMNKVKELFFNKFNQCAILFIFGKVANLLLPNGDTEDIGVFRKATETEAKDNGCFTYLAGEYYIAKSVYQPVWGECHTN